VNDRVLLEAKGLTKVFRLEQERATTFKEVALALFRPLRPGGGRRAREVLALEGIDFRLERGEVVGVVGPNGAGKTTLLSVLGGVLRPTEGRVVRRSKPAILLEASVGFRPELTGMENMRLLASLMGVRFRELLPHLEEVLEFAELDGFLSSPVRAYSQGMLARLSVSLLLHLPRDILLLDEVLGPGDRDFRERCSRRIRELASLGKGVVMVSHDLEAVRQSCTRAIWLEKGKVVMEGSAEEVVEAYGRRGSKDGG